MSLPPHLLLSNQNLKQDSTNNSTDTSTNVLNRNTSQSSNPSTNLNINESLSLNAQSGNSNSAHSTESTLDIRDELAKLLESNTSTKDSMEKDNNQNDNVVRDQYDIGNAQNNNSLSNLFSLPTAIPSTNTNPTSNSLFTMNNNLEKTANESKADAEHDNDLSSMLFSVLGGGTERKEERRTIDGMDTTDSTMDTTHPKPEENTTVNDISKEDKTPLENGIKKFNVKPSTNIQDAMETDEIINAGNTGNAANTNNTSNTGKVDNSKNNQQSIMNFDFETTEVTTIHTSINISIDLNHHLLAGYVDLYLKNTTSLDINELQLNVADQMKIEGVYEIKSFDKESDELVSTNFVEVVHNKLTTRETMAYANAESSESSEHERSLSWAMDIRKKQIMMSNAGLLAITFKENWKKGTYLRLRVFYQIVRPSAGVYFVDSVEEEEPIQSTFSDSTKSKVNGHCYTCNFSGGARTWFPCIDTVENFSSYEIEITTHKDAIVVCTGNLTEQSDNNEMGIRTTKFVHNEYPIPPYAIGFAIGPFKVYIDEELPHITHFYPQRFPVSHIKHTVLYLRQVLDYYTSLTEVPLTDFCSCYSVVFLDAPYTSMIPMYSLGIVSSDYILDPAVIDDLIKKRVEFSSIIASQYFGGLLLPKYINDFWIVVGWSKFMGLLFLEFAYGENELKWYLIEKCEEMPKIDNATCSLASISTFYQVVNQVVQEKAPLVIYMLGEIIGNKSVGSWIQLLVSRAIINMDKILQEVTVPDSAVDRNGQKIDASFIAMEKAILETRSNRVLSTKELRTHLTTVYRKPKQDIRDFFAYWVQGRGFPQFQCAYTYDPNRSKILIAMRQLYSVDSEATVYVGNIRFAIHEFQEFSYYSIVRVTSAYFWTELDCTAKPRKNQKKDGSVEVNYEIPIHYIIPNSGLQVMCQINMWQDVSQWMYQVEREKDIFGLYTAVLGLKYWQSQSMLSHLKGMLHSNDCYFRIRYAILDIFSEATCPELAEQVFSMLREAFSQKFCDKLTKAPLPNDFSNVIDYYLKRKLIKAFGLVRRENGYTPESSVELIRSLLQNNDNSRNKFSDTFYLGTLLQAITSVKPQKQNIEEVERWNKKYLVLDSLIPSQHCHFSVVTLENLTDLFISGRLPLDLTIFEERLRPEVHIRVRETALQCLTSIHDKQFPNYPHRLNFRKVFHQVIDQILDGDDPPVYKHRMCRVLIGGIDKCSARMMEYMLRAKNSQDTSLERFLKQVRSESKKNRHLVERLWKHTLDHRDARLQSDITDLYFSLWGFNAPSCYCRKPAEFVHTVRIDKYDAILCDPIYPVIQYKEPEKATTSETSVGFKVTRMTIITGENAPPFVSSHSSLLPETTPPISTSSHIESDLPTPNLDHVKHTSFESERKRKHSMGPPKRKRKRQVEAVSVPETIQQTEGPVTKYQPMELSTHPSIPTYPNTSELLPSSNAVEALGQLAIPTQNEFHILEHTTFEKIGQSSQTMTAVVLTPHPIPKFNFFCELIIYEGPSPIIIPIELHDSYYGNAIYRKLPLYAPALTDIDGLIYTAMGSTPIPPSNNTSTLTKLCNIGDILYWPVGESVTFPYGKTPITHEKQKNISLYGDCEVIASTLIRVPISKKKTNLQNVHSMQIRRGRSFKATFTDPVTNQELCTVYGCLNHTAIALDFFKKMTPFLGGGIVAYNQMLGFTLGESTFTQDTVVLNNKSFYRNYLENTELALWTSHESETRTITTLLMGTGPGVAPEKGGRYPLITKCNIIGRFEPSQAYNDLKMLIQHQQPLYVVFSRNFMIVNIASILIEMNVSDTLCADHIFANLPINGQCQLISGFLVIRIAGLKRDKQSTHQAPEAKAGSLIYWSDKDVLILCLKDTPLPSNCSEIATIVEGYDAEIEQLAKLDSNIKHKINIAAAELGVNVGR